MRKSITGAPGSKMLVKIKRGGRLIQLRIVRSAIEEKSSLLLSLCPLAEREMAGRGGGGHALGGGEMKRRDRESIEEREGEGERERERKREGEAAAEAQNEGVFSHTGGGVLKAQQAGRPAMPALV